MKQFGLARPAVMGLAAAFVSAAIAA